MKLKDLLDVTQYDKRVSVNDINGVHIDTVRISEFAILTKGFENIAPYLNSEVALVSTTPNLSLYVEINVFYFKQNS